MHDKPVVQERDGWTSIFQPDVLRPQYLEKWRYQRSHEPKMLNVRGLKTRSLVFKDFLRLQTRGRAAFSDAEDWLMHEKSDWFFSSSLFARLST